MSQEMPAAASLKYPQIRIELISELEDLRRSDLADEWKRQANAGLVAGIDQVFHFFFDDHDFDAGDIGYVLFDEREVTAVKAVKRALEHILETNRDGGDAYFLGHPEWSKVASAAAAAHALLTDRDRGTRR
ncbi:MAG: hypothetical protein KF842_07485 [Caulobacter sp.]|nr:hypothetical protein [Caulobacter sp.]